MITQFFPRRSPGQTMDQLVACREAPADSAGAGAADTAVVESVVRAVMAYAEKRKRVKGCVTETGLRTFVSNVLTERTPLFFPQGPNPVSPTPCTMPQLLHRFFGTAVDTQVTTWQTFYNATKSCWGPLCDAILAQRQRQHLDVFFQPEPAETAAQPHPLKRRRTTPATPTLEMVPTTAVVVTLEGATVDALDQWEQAHLVMRNTVVRMQESTSSPPASPRAPKAAITKLTESEQLQCSVLRASRAWRGSARGVDHLNMLFHTFAIDTAPQPHYDPQFDRNDLFLTNVGATRQLLKAEQQYTSEAVRRKAAGESMSGLPCPAVYIVAIQYAGPLVASDMVTATYVTWCVHTDLTTSSALSSGCEFLDAVLSGRVRLNNMFTEFLDRVARYSCQDGALWKKRFSVVVLDSSGGAISERTLPGVVALVDTYAEQHGGVGKSKGVDGHPHIGLNVVQHHHAKHRLIYECGSFEAYRVLWHCNRHKDAYILAHGKAMELADVAVSTASLWWQQLRAFLNTLLPLTDVADGATGTGLPQLHSLAKLLLESVSGFEESAKEAQRARQLFVRSAEERKETVSRTYAQASVQQYRDGCSIQASLVDLFESLQRNPLGDVPVLSTVATASTLVSAARQVVVHTWFAPCTAVADVPWKKLVAQHDEAAAWRAVKLLHALMVLRLWAPDEWGDKTQPLPAPPPRRLDAAMIATGFRAHILHAHVDKNVRDIQEGRTTEVSQHEQTQRVLNARTYLRNVFVDVTVDEAMTSVS